MIFEFLKIYAYLGKEMKLHSTLHTQSGFKIIFIRFIMARAGNVRFQRTKR